MAMALVNQVDAFSNTTFDPAVFTVAATNHTAGNLLIVLVMTQAQGSSLTITDTAGDLFTNAGSVVTQGPANRLWIYYTLATNGHSSNVVEVSVGNVGNASYHAMAVLQVSTDNESALDDNDGDTGSGTTASTPSLTLSGTDGFIAAIAVNNGQAQVAGSGYTLHIIADGGGGFTAYEYKPVSASEAPTMTCGSGDWGMKSALFKDTGGVASVVVLLPQAVM